MLDNLLTTGKQYLAEKSAYDHAQELAKDAQDKAECDYLFSRLETYFAALLGVNHAAFHVSRVQFNCGEYTTEVDGCTVVIEMDEFRERVDRDGVYAEYTLDVKVRRSDELETAVKDGYTPKFPLSGNVSHNAVNLTGGSNKTTHYLFNPSLQLKINLVQIIQRLVDNHIRNVAGIPVWREQKRIEDEREAERKRKYADEQAERERQYERDQVEREAKQKAHQEKRAAEEEALAALFPQIKAELTPHLAAALKRLMHEVLDERDDHEWED